VTMRAANGIARLVVALVTLVSPASGYMLAMPDDPATNTFGAYNSTGTTRLSSCPSGASTTGMINRVCLHGDREDEPDHLPRLWIS